MAYVEQQDNGRLFDFRSNGKGTDFIGWVLPPNDNEKRTVNPTLHNENKLCIRTEPASSEWLASHCKPSVYDLDFPELIQLLPRNRTD